MVGEISNTIRNPGKRCVVVHRCSRGATEKGLDCAICGCLGSERLPAIQGVDNGLVVLSVSHTISVGSLDAQVGRVVEGLEERLDAGRYRAARGVQDSLCDFNRELVGRISAVFGTASCSTRVLVPRTR